MVPWLGTCPRSSSRKADFDVIEIAVDVRVIELHRGHDQQCAGVGSGENFGVLSKKAVSYSSPSTTKCSPCRLSRKLPSKSCEADATH